jgi:diguanylate cyclase (GGDEF)-like protein/PAS domain S-box-containing protein
MDVPTILVVEDKQILEKGIKNGLQKLGYLVQQIRDSGETAIQKFAEIHHYLVLINVFISDDMSVFKIANIIRNNYQIPVLYLTDSTEDISLKKKLLIEPFNHIFQAFVEKDLHIAAEMALYKNEIENRQKNEQQNEQLRLSSIVSSMGCALIVTDVLGRVEMMNPLAEKMTGWKRDEAVGEGIEEVFKIVDEETGELINPLGKEIIQPDDAFNPQRNSILIAKDGTRIHIGNNITLIRNANGKITGTVAVFQDISEHKRLQSQLMRNAFYDGLTALPNRLLFQDRLRQVIERSKRHIDYKFAVLFLDLDGFKQVNDRYGHAMGDSLLIAIARQLESCLRSVDTVARFGGDEFAILLEGIKDISDATAIATRINEIASVPICIDGYNLSVGASIGITFSDGAYDDPDKLLKNADVAMYRAKNEGKGTFVVFE